MIPIAKIALFVFGLFTLVGGVMGYVKAGSTASLIAGGISGLLLLAAGFMVQRGMIAPGLITGAVISLALVGHFLRIFLDTHKMMPAGITSVLGIISLVLCVVALVKK